MTGLTSHPVAPWSGLPLALPVAWSNDRPSAQVTATSGASRGTNTSSSPSTSSVRVGGRRLAQLEQSLSPRDHRILDLLLGHRYLTTPQLERFCFADHTSAASGARTARRVLRRLARDGLIAPLTRRIGGVRAGSASYVWQLASGGARLVAGKTGYRTHEPSLRFLGHCLAVADAHLVVLDLQRDGQVLDVSVQLEPVCWRTFTGVGGERRLLQPDLFVRTTTPDYEDRWFIEVDLGTESLPTLLGKCAQYEAYRPRAQEQSASAVFTLVVVQLLDAERRDRLASRIARSLSLTPALYQLVTPEEFGRLIAGGTV